GNQLPEEASDAPPNFDLVSDSTSVTLNAASTWESMSTILIAVAFLLVGAKVASESGAAGAGMATKGVDLGKKATGFIARKMPMVGGDAWKKRGQRVGATAKGLGRLAKTRMPVIGDLARNERAKKMERGTGMITSGVSGWKPTTRGKKVARLAALAGLRTAGKVGAMLTETGGRKDKRAKDWGKIAEQEKERVERGYSTSGSISGKIKQDSTARLNIETKLSEEKKSGKLAAKQVELSGKDKSFQEKQKIVSKTAAKRQEDERILNRKSEMDTARNRDKLLIADGQLPRYVEDVEAKHYKEDLEVAGSSNIDRTLANIGIRKDQIRAETDPEKKKKLQRDMANTMAFCGSRGAVFSVNGVNIATADMGLAPIEAGDVVGQQAKELSAILQRKVDADPGDIQTALGEMENIMGDGYTAFMRSFTDGLAKSSVDGAVSKAGLFREEIEVGSNNIPRSKFVAVDPTDASPDGLERKKWSDGKRGYALSQAKYGRMEGFEGSLDQVEVGGETKHVITSDEAVKRTAAMWGGVSSNVTASVDMQNIDTFNEAFENMHFHEVQNLLDEMMKKAKDTQGIMALMKRTNLVDTFGAGTLHLTGAGGVVTPIT
ncbi:hypothetical protein KJ641_00035, partial [Patescibacteria group bacterium]|nr:hypothetical protein [Patescibacteria group bacterium]MBU1895248.1 hypothetical protein [Patescibacteria group bacterium]